MTPKLKTARRDPKKTKLSKSFTVAQYDEFVATHNREKIASLIRERFKERFVLPLHSKQKHGFTIMAICCLMIETLESFRQGWTNTKGKTTYKGKEISKSECAFHLFFQNNDNAQFRVLIGFEKDFWKGIRCGILHQAETTNGWHILRKGPLFEPTTKDINATEFLKRIEETLNRYCDTLTELDWDSIEWQNAITKLQQICANCVETGSPIINIGRVHSSTNSV